MEQDIIDEATVLSRKMFKALPAGTNSTALILALQSMLGTVIGRTAVDVENKKLYSSIAEELYKTAVFARYKRGALTNCL